MPHAVPFDEASRRRMHRRRAVKGAAKLTLAVGILGVLVWNLRGDVDEAIEKYFHKDYYNAGSWGKRGVGKKDTGMRR